MLHRTEFNGSSQTWLRASPFQHPRLDVSELVPLSLQPPDCCLEHESNGHVQ